MKKMKPILVIACAIVLVSSCKKFCEPPGNGGGSGSPSRLREVISGSSRLSLFYDASGLVDSIRMVDTPGAKTNSVRVFRYIRHGNTIDSVMAITNGELSYTFKVFHYDNAGRIKDYIKYARAVFQPDFLYSFTYDQRGDLNTMLRSASYTWTSDTLRFDDRHNMIYSATALFKYPFTSRSNWYYDNGINPLYIKDVFVALLDVGYFELLFSQNNVTHQDYVLDGPSSTTYQSYDFKNEYDIKNRLVRKTYANGAALQFTYY